MQVTSIVKYPKEVSIPDFTRDKLMVTTLQQVAENRPVALQQLPAHCGIPGTEKANELAKRPGTRTEPSSGQA